MFLTSSSFEILVKTRQEYFQFLDFWSISYKKKLLLQNSKTSNDIDMTVGTVTRHDKRNIITSKKFGNDVISENCDVIAVFPICGQSGAIRKPEYRCIVYKNFYFH